MIQIPRDPNSHLGSICLDIVVLLHPVQQEYYSWQQGKRLEFDLYNV